MHAVWKQIWCRDLARSYGWPLRVTPTTHTNQITLLVKAATLLNPQVAVVIYSQNIKSLMGSTKRHQGSLLSIVLRRQTTTNIILLHKKHLIKGLMYLKVQGEGSLALVTSSARMDRTVRAPAPYLRVRAPSLNLIQKDPPLNMAKQGVEVRSGTQWL